MAEEMLSVVAQTYTKPSGYELAKVPKPVVTEKTDVVIRVHAASINPIDTKKAAGAMKAVAPDEFPYKLGYDAAGTVEAVGEAVTKFQVGQAVYVRVPESGRGTWCEYTKCSEYFVAPKPKNVSFGGAASIPLAATTALQALRKYKGSLEGKTVLVPAGLSGTGAYACQLAKNVFHAGKVITTVSTAKVPLVPKLLGEGVVDQVIDYTKEDVLTAVPRGSVDFVFDTTGEAMKVLSLVTPTTGTIVSISTSPSGETLDSVVFEMQGKRIPTIVRWILDAQDAVSRLRARRWGVAYEYLFLNPNGKDLEFLGQAVEDGQLVPVVGATVDFHDIDKVREACSVVDSGKGGLGKTVFEVVRE